MNVFTYVVEHDLGFAPNPFHGVCTLACCKPRIRRKAERGDIVLGTGAALPQLRGHLTYWMQVDEITTFDTPIGTTRAFVTRCPSCSERHSIAMVTISIIATGRMPITNNTRSIVSKTELFRPVT